MSVVPRTLPGAEAVPAPPGALVRSGLLRHPGVVFGSVVLAALTVMAIFAPWLGTGDPLAINPVERGHIAFRTDDIEAFRRRLRERGIPFCDYGAWAMKGWEQIFFYDPDGNIVEVHQVRS